MARALIHDVKQTSYSTIPSIRIIDGILAKADKPLIKPISEVLKYEKEVARPSQFGTKIKRQTAYFIDRRNGQFLCGFIDRIVKYLDNKNIQYNIDGWELMGKPGPMFLPQLIGLTLREDQLNLIRKTSAYKGVILSPTGSGKTIIALGVISQWPTSRALILANRKDIIDQFAERASKYLPNRKIQIITGGNRPPITGDIVIATMQTFIKYPTEQTYNLFDITITDECHHVADRKSQFGIFAQKNLSPVKIGFTATAPTELQRLLAMEGLIGPIIGEITQEEGEKMGIIAKPFVTLLTIPYNNDIGDLRKYRDIYNAGISHNRARNVRIIKAAKERAIKGLTSLIMIREIPHGEELMYYAKIFGLNVFFVHGNTSKNERERIKQLLIDKEINSVIVTDVWREGVDIPTLNTVIMAGLGKSPLQTIQSVGRVTRATKDKTHVEVIDFLDPYRYLARHAMQRLIIYTEKGWL